MGEGGGLLDSGQDTVDSRALRPPSYATLMVGLAGVTLLALLGFHILTPWLGPTAGLHVLLAVGVLPLVLGAIGYFTPALTQTRPPPARLVASPALAALGGMLTVSALRGSLELLALAVPLSVGAAAALLVWTLARARAGLGDPHPCLRWYQASLLCLCLALIAIGIAALRPTWWLPLRRLHLHLNLLGFVGLAAVGTLHVLLPTVGKFTDPTAARRLHRGLPFALAGTALIAVGAAWPDLRPLSYVGTVCWFVPLAGLTLVTVRNHTHFAPSLHSNSLPLVGALIGLALSLVAGAVGGLVDVEPRAVLGLFGFGFLFPLITGALGHLLPVWRWPGPPTPSRARASRILAWGGGLRAIAFPTAGAAYALGVSEASFLASFLLLIFLLQAVAAVILSSRTPA